MNELDRINYELENGDKAYPKYDVNTAKFYREIHKNIFRDKTTEEIIADDKEILCENESGRFYVVTRDYEGKIDSMEEVDIEFIEG